MAPCGSCSGSLILIPGILLLLLTKLLSLKPSERPLNVPKLTLRFCCSLVFASCSPFFVVARHFVTDQGCSQNFPWANFHQFLKLGRREAVVAHRCRHVNVPLVMAQRPLQRQRQQSHALELVAHSKQLVPSLRILLLYRQVSRRGCHTDNTSEHTCVPPSSLFCLSCLKFSLATM